MENIQKVKGTIDSLGGGASLPGKAVRTNFVIKTADGKLKVFKTVSALGLVANYTEVGVSGTFHILKIGGDNFLLLAIERDDGSEIVDMDAYEREYKNCKSINGSGNFIVVLGVLLLPIIIGLFLIPKGFSIKKGMKEFIKYNPESLKSYLSKEQLEIS